MAEYTGPVVAMQVPCPGETGMVGSKSRTDKAESCTGPGSPPVCAHISSVAVQCWAFHFTKLLARLFKMLSSI